MWQFSRTVAPETSKGAALISVMRYYEWQKTVFLTSTDGVWFQSTLQLVQQLQAAGLEVQQLPAFEPGAFNDKMLGQIKQFGIRIVILSAYEVDAKDVAYQSERAEMRKGWAWVHISSTQGSSQSFVGWLYMRPCLSSEDMEVFAQQVSAASKSSFNISNTGQVDLTYSVALHDAVVLYARAATQLLSRGGDLLDGQSVIYAMQSTAFEGVGGRVVLNEHGDRIHSHEIVNYAVGLGGRMGSFVVGVYNNTVQKYRLSNVAVVWPGSVPQVPTDYIAACHPGEVVQGGVCRMCSAGMYNNDTGVTMCQKCAPGFISEELAWRCKPCQPGMFAQDPGLGSCSKCDVRDQFVL